MYSRVRRLRTERGWSQAALGEKLGVSRQTINAIEGGKYDPSLPLAFAIARLFKLPIEKIFDPDKTGSEEDLTQSTSA
ncbi:MAG TPA: helix-turn-helix transcriptional regulator [Gammaproteobacteria bacterium]